MTQIHFWPWWFFALLGLNIFLAVAVILRLWITKAVPRLLMLRVYLWYSLIAGLGALLVASVTPARHVAYWHYVTVVEVGFNAVLFLLSAQIVYRLLKRNDMLVPKRLWLLGLPLAFLIVVLTARMNPEEHVKALYSFNALAMLMVFLVALAAYITEREDWIKGYPAVLVALCWQIGSTALLPLLPVQGLWMSGPLFSAVTLVLFILAAPKKQTVH